MDNEAAPAYTPKSYERRKEPASPPPVYNPAKVTNGKSDRHDRGLEEKDIDAESARIDANLSDVETGEFDEWHQMFRQHAEKRVHELELVEETKRKRRRLNITQKLLATFEAASTQAKLNYIKDHEERAWGEVQAAEIAEEKERKKDMQRKRRREKTLAAESAKRASAIQRAAQAADAEERERLIKEAQKHEKKLRITTKLLQGETPNKELLEVTPHGPNLEGGTMSTFQASDEPKEAPRRGRAGRQSTRPRKSKEQKQAEKDAAAAAQAALDRGEELPPIAPKESARLERLAQKEAEHSQTEEPVAPPPAAAPVVDAQPFTSKSYNQLYEQIWKEIGKNVYKVHRIKNDSLTVRMSNHRKTAQLAAKEARRWQLRTNKSQKDVQARAKRSMREMVSFWKRNERDERDQRKVAERQELENAKKAEAEREANRQRRKLNFLISQTELYSHFIGKKVKTDELERTEGDGSAAPVPDTEQPADTVDGPVRNFEELDFDDDDETDLQNAARANAQHAVREAQEAAQRFNEGAFDEGEMNFQNPTSLQSMDIPQPKMLSCQLKEYQLKGLNWLVNLYEQGINGILADEMGLGKTVQSISVMSYLAENHNIWGPFLVIAPASTLHNWQQEIVKFVPDLKVLPYWGNAKDRKILRKFWDRKHITYRQDSPFHVLVTSYQLVVQDAQYFQKIKWQYMILDEAQAIKSSQSSRWKSLLGFHCRNRLLLTGTPIQNNMQELWALLHFIMPSLFDSHDEFSDWFSKDIESHAQSNTKLNEDQLKRLHMILKPFMLRRIKKHVQKELGDKIELDVFCDLTYRQRAYYTNLRNKISIMDLIEKAAVGDDQDTATLMNLVMQFRKVCNHPDLFERADTSSPFSFSHFAETASFMREGQNINVAYSVRNLIEYRVPRAIFAAGGRIDLPGPHNDKAGWRNHFLHHRGLSIWTPTNIRESARSNGAFAWQRFADVSPGEVAAAPRNGVFERALEQRTRRELGRFNVLYDGEDENTYAPSHALFNIVEKSARKPLVEATSGTLAKLFNIAQTTFDDQGLGLSEACAVPGATAPPIELVCSSQAHLPERDATFFNPLVRTALYRVPERIDEALVEEKVLPTAYPAHDLLPEPVQKHSRYTHISVPSMRRFVTDSGKLARLDALLRELKEGGHRVLLYFQMTRMIDLMEEYLTYRNYKYCRLDGSTKLEDRRDTVADFQTRPEIFVFLLSTRAGGLGINLTSADTVIFYDSDWNPTIDSQAMDRAHRLGQTRQVTVYRLITRGTIEERIRKRALQKEEVQRVVISGGAGVDFNTRSRENRTKDIALWLADDDQAAEIEKKEKEKEAEAAAVGQDGLKVPPVASRKKKAPGTAAAAAGKKKEVSMDDMYHEGEGHFDDVSAKASGAATPVDAAAGPPAKKRKGGGSKKAKTVKQRLAIADGMADPGSFQ
ncbi:SNF2 family DNA-dependent ATPase domain-containing protein [Trichodelitschia bisporula]|uniref:Chromatin-remodeling ATPase INO80 n=1 Tax=Trichodelitschia bisporula TaxID=703511 RepID=A0A6G1I901_9PEZI|nr:SNF2 family DNA-dependent ATPase domain-containing protein [Trichodelitschia bisporula]